ncbi:MAG: glycosyltransferase family 4 protein [Anaerolineaceae bacterium]|nr:glycosyltransferase family 4 protein [Anaerolineaceae bacterium]
MHYYNFSLTAELNKLDVDITLVSTFETAINLLRPEHITILPGFKGIYGETPKYIRGLRYAYSLLKIKQLILRSRPQITHFHFFQIPILDYLFLEVLEKIPTKRIITIHDVVPFAYGADVTVARHGFLHKIYQNASGLIVNSNHSMQKLADLDANLLKKTIFIQPGAYTKYIPEQKFTTSEAKISLGLEPNTPIVLVFGTIKPNKRLDLVIEAISHLIATWPDIRLVIAGQTQDRDVNSEIALVKSLGISKNVIWKLERVSDEKMMLLFSTADVIVFPYQWIYQSAALLMAMSLRKAVIATAVGSNQDIIEDGKSGLLVSTTDARETAVAIQKLLADPQYAARLAKAAKKDVTERFSWESIAQETKQFYTQILHQD